MSIISGGFPKYSIRDYVMGLSSNGYVLKDVGCGEYATTTAICHGGDCTYPQRMRNIRAAAGLPDHPPSSGPRPKKGKGASASAAPPRLEEPYGRWSGGPESPSTPAPRYVNWGPHDRCKKLELRREQDIIDAIRHDSKVAEFGCRLGIHPEIAGLPTAPQPAQPHPMRVTVVTDQEGE